MSGPFSSRLIATLVTVAVVSFLLAFVLSAFGDKLDEPRSWGSDGYSVSAIGHAGWLELMRDSGLAVEQRRRLRERVHEPDVLVALEPRAREESLADDLYGLAEHSLFEGAPLVLVLPKWRAMPDFERVGWVQRPRFVDLDGVRSGLESFIEIDLGLDEIGFQRDAAERDGLLACESADGDRFELFTRGLQYLEPGLDWTPWLTCDGEVVVAYLDSYQLWLVADPEPFTNAGLAEGDNAALTLALFRERLGARGLVVDETIHGHGFEDSLLAQWLSFPLGLAVAHGLIVVALFVWHGSRRFGFLRDARSERIDGRRVLVDNAARLLTLGLHSRATLLDYFDQTLRDVATHFPLRRDASLDTLLSELQTLSERRGSTLGLEALRRSILALPASGRVPAERITRIARRLHGWRTEMIDGHRTDR